MTDYCHFAALESPAAAMRALCGAWRMDVAWTTVRDRVTCPECSRRLHGALAAPPVATAAPRSSAGRPAR